MKLKPMKWRSDPIKYGKSKWAYRDKHNIYFLEKCEATQETKMITVQLRWLNKILGAK